MKATGVLKGTLFVLLLFPSLLQAEEFINPNADSLKFSDLKVNGKNLAKVLLRESQEIIELLNEETKSNDTDYIQDVKRRRQICSKLDELNNNQIALNAINILNDKILQFGTDKNLKYLPKNQVYKKLFPAPIVHVLINMQNELFRSTVFCESTIDVIRLDFDYVLLGVEPDNITELRESLDYIHQSAFKLDKHFSELPDSESELKMRTDESMTEQYRLNYETTTST